MIRRALLPSLLAALVLLSCGVSALQAAPVQAEIENIHPKYLEAENFKRIWEYLTGRKPKPRRVVVRTDEDQLGGMYFVATMDRCVRQLPAGLKAKLEVIHPGKADAEIYELSLPDKRPVSKEILLGLTGADWELGDETPPAWRLTLYTDSGELVAQRKSYLWSLDPNQAE